MAVGWSVRVVWRQPHDLDQGMTWVGRRDRAGQVRCWLAGWLAGGLAGGERLGKRKECSGERWGVQGAGVESREQGLGYVGAVGSNGSRLREAARRRVGRRAVGLSVLGSTAS